MPTSSENKTGKGNTATSGDHDRVAMLSLKADGTPDQTNPEFIDPEASKEATRRQFSEQAVSAADVEARGASAGSPVADKSKRQDPEIKKLEEAHKKAASAGEKAADAALKSLDGSDSDDSGSGSGSGGSGS